MEKARQYQSAPKGTRNCLLAVIAIVLAIATTALADGKPRLSIDSPIYNFGTVRQGERVVTDFNIQNTGEGELVLQRVVPACGCTATSSNKDKLAAGEKASVHVEFDTTGFSGEKLKTVRIFSNDPDQPSSVLTLQGVVEPDVSVEPARLIFPEVVRGEAVQGASQEFTVKVRPGASARLGEVKAFSKSFTVTELESSPTLKRIKVQLDPNLPPGEIRDRVVIAMTGASASSLNVPVIASISGKLQLKPVALSFGVIEGTKSYEKTVRLENLGSMPVRVLSAFSENPAISSEIKKVREGKVYEIKVSLDPAKVKKDLRATLTITTDSPTEGTVSLAVYGVLPLKP